MKNVNIHVIETFPSSCANRDETGDPKTGTFGGVVRARISSQCWKRVSRDMFPEKGVRTRNAPKMIADEIKKIDPSLDSQELVKTALKKISLEPKDGKTGALVFLTQAQARAVAELAVSGVSAKKDYINAMNSNPTVDISMFGRMVAGEDELKVEGAVQVAQALSTHAVYNEYDFGSGIDDLTGETAILFSSAFSSATFYRFANVDIDELRQTTGEQTGKAVRNFAEAFIYSVPHGKISSYAQFVLPNFVSVTLRDDQPVNMVDAFEEPVKGPGYAKKSIEALDKYAEWAYDNIISRPVAAYSVGADTKNLGERVSLSEMLDSLERMI